MKLLLTVWLFSAVSGGAVGYAIAVLNITPKQPDIFDSMLCSVHTPVGAILVNDELIKASNGKIYRWIEE